MNSWQPIDTAPRDGSYMLGYGKLTGLAAELCVHGPSVDAIHWQVRPSMEDGGFWASGIRENFAPANFVTHWMPLPPSPVDDKPRKDDDYE